jgi:hypothetical protein
MSETAQTLINGAARAIGVLAKGETMQGEDAADFLKAMQYMLENWSANGVRVWFVTTEDLTYSASPSTIGTGATLNTARPEKILAAFLDGAELEIVDYKKYLILSNNDGQGYLYYAPEYPFGKIYVNGAGTLKLSSLKPLTDPTVLTSTISFPPEYNDAIKWNLAVRMAPEYGKVPSDLVVNLAVSTLRAIENKNFDERIRTADIEVIKFSNRYNIDEG